MQHCIQFPDNTKNPKSKVSHYLKDNHTYIPFTLQRNHILNNHNRPKDTIKIVSTIDFPEPLIATYLILSKRILFLTIFLVPCIVVISTYLAIATINEIIRNPRVIYASPAVQ